MQNPNRIPGLEYPELSQDYLIKLKAEQGAAEITLTGASLQIISEMKRIIRRLFWEFSHQEYGFSAEKMAEDMKVPVELVEEALKFPLTKAEVDKVFG